jgi:GLPGLI family protein
MTLNLRKKNSGIKIKFIDMKTKTLYFCLSFIAILFFQKGLNAQNTEGIVKYTATYDWIKMMKACPWTDKSKQDRNAYMWGNDSEWKMKNTLYFSPRVTKFEESQANEENMGYQGRKETFFRIRKFENNTMYDAFVFLGKTIIISDSLQKPDWKIKNDIKEVAGHICMNAVYYDSLRYQKVEAWFALDIPISAGPDRFCGLPGLILEVNINNGAKIITAESIEFKALTTECDPPKKVKGKVITATEFDAMTQKYIDERKKMEEFPWEVRY